MIHPAQKALKPTGQIAGPADEDSFLSDTHKDIIHAIENSKLPLRTIPEIAKATTIRYEPDSRFRGFVADLSKRYKRIAKENGQWVVKKS
jgi:hypothetical protein